MKESMDSTGSNKHGDADAAGVETNMLNQVLHALPGMAFRLRRTPNTVPQLIYVSQQIQTFFALSPLEAVIDPGALWSKIHPDDAPKLLASIKYASEKVKTLTSEFRILPCKHQTLWVKATATSELDDAGAQLWTGYLEDISSQKLLQEKLLISNFAMQPEQARISDFLFEIDQNGVVLVTHSAFTTTTTGLPDAMIGQSIEAVLPEAAHQIVKRLIQLLDAKGGRQHDFYAVESAGEKVWFEVSAIKRQDHPRVYAVLIRDATNKRQIEDQLLLNQFALNSVSQGIVVTDLQQRVVTINEAFTAITGYSIEDVKGKNLKLKQGKDTDPRVVNEIRRALKENVMFDGELINYRKDGTPFWNHLTIIPVINQVGEPVNYLGILRDLTRRKRAEQRRRVDTVALNALSEAIMVTDAQRNIVSVNQAFVDLTGYTSEEMVGKKARFYATQNSPEVIARIREALTKQLPFAGQVTSYKKDRSTFQNALTIRPVFDKHQQLTHFVGVIRDVTQTEKLQHMIEESHNLLRTIIDAAPVKIYWKDKAARYLGCNQAYAQEIGLQDPAQIVGKDDTQLLAPADAEKNRAIFEDIMRQGKAKLFYEEQHINPSGRPCWILKSKVPFKNKHDVTIGVLGLYEDITARKEEQEKLKKTKQALLESRERYLDLYEFAPIGYISIDGNGMIVEANWKARVLLGMKRKEVGKERLSRYVATPHKREWQSIFTALKSLNYGGEMEFELQIAQEQGRMVDAKLSCVRVDDTVNNSILRVTMADITHAKYAEHLLRQKEGYQRSLLDNFPYMVWLKDDQGRFLTVNSAFLRSAGFTSHIDVVGKTDLDVWPLELAKTYMQDDQEVMLTRSSKTIDECMEVGGKYVWYETYKSPVVVNGEVIGTVGFAHDISSRKRASQYDQFRTRVLELLVREHDLDVIFDTITKGMEQLNPMMFCLIALLNESKKTLHIASAPSLPAPFVNALEGMKAGMGIGSIGTVAFTKQRLIVSDVTNHPFWTKNRELAQQAGIGSSWAEPIIAANGNVLGVLGVYHHHSHSPTEDDITLIEQSARLISIGIERSANSTKIENLAYYDEITSLPNRRFLLEQLKRAMVINLETRSHVALLYLDLDKFKVINDSRGHEVGDLLLIEVANRLRRSVQAVDVVARIGGDEFVVLLENLSENLIEAAKQAEVVAGKILKLLRKPYTLAKQKHHSSASIGITVVGKQKTDLEEMLKQADIAMYQAKKSGRNTFCFFDHQMQANISTLVTLENELRNAVKLEQLQLYYQVQVDHMGQPFGAEALLRWIHPERGMVSPAQFIPLAEESGLIIPIGNWVLDMACAQIKAWQSNPGTRDITLSVNISAKQFRQVNFVDEVKACIERHGIDPMLLRLELTETVLLENVEDTVEYMSTLGKFGVQFSLDDFGTGYSSLQYLKRLPLYQLKIDQSFVRDLVNDSHDRTIVRTIIAMAQSMYIGVIAEGVETIEQQELLLTNGCRRYQGYLFGKPMPIEAFNARFESSER